MAGTVAVDCSREIKCEEKQPRQEVFMRREESKRKNSKKTIFRLTIFSKPETTVTLKRARHPLFV